MSTAFSRFLKAFFSTSFPSHFSSTEDVKAPYEPGVEQAPVQPGSVLIISGISRPRQGALGPHSLAQG